MTAGDSSGQPATAAAAIARRKAAYWPKRAAAGVGALIVVAVVGAYVLPREPVVTRSVAIAAPAATVFPLVADLRRFPEWSPWFATDPDIVLIYTGPTDGVGQTVSWESRLPTVGSGRETITASRPDSSVAMTIEFADQGTAEAWFELTAEGATTRVVWGFRTDLGLNPVNRYSGLWIDGIVGPDFERGLARLKAVAEAPPKN